jgi:multiple sugar transport system permease protein
MSSSLTPQAEKRKPAEKHKVTRFEKERERWAYLFISPWMVGFVAFTLIPVVATLVLSFTNYNPVNADATQFIGINNYIQMLHDNKVIESLMVTLKYGILSVPISMIVGLGLASLVNSKSLMGKNFFRTMFYMPSMIPVVAGALVWSGVMNTQSGWLNQLLGVFKIKGPDWLNDTTWIYPALVLIGLWGLGNLMLTLLAGMQGVPNELYEAALMDGASNFQQFLKITLPMITPVIFYNLTLMIIGSFKYFDLAFVLKNGSGGPADSTLFYNLNLYKNAFTFNLMGYGSALAWVLFIIVLILTIFLFNTSGRWVYYAGDKG